MGDRKNILDVVIDAIKDEEGLYRDDTEARRRALAAPGVTGYLRKRVAARKAAHDAADTERLRRLIVAGDTDAQETQAANAPEAFKTIQATGKAGAFARQRIYPTVLARLEGRYLTNAHRVAQAEWERMEEEEKGRWTAEWDEHRLAKHRQCLKWLANGVARLTQGISPLQKNAGDKFSETYREAVSAFGPKAQDLMRIGGGGSSALMTDARLIASHADVVKAYDAVKRINDGTLVLNVVVGVCGHDESLADVCRRFGWATSGKGAGRAIGHLRRGLDALIDHYAEQEPRKRGLKNVSHGTFHEH